MTAPLYAPTMHSLLRKYQGHSKEKLFDITDEKKAYFYIDTSQYMNYTNSDLQDEYHVEHGPQPEGESMNSSWMIEVDKVLRGEEHHLKDHPRYLNYNYELKDKSFPTADMASDLMHK